MILVDHGTPWGVIIGIVALIVLAGVVLRWVERRFDPGASGVNLPTSPWAPWTWP